MNASVHPAYGAAIEPAIARRATHVLTAVGRRALLLAPVLVVLVVVVVLAALVAYRPVDGPIGGDGRAPSPSPQAPARPR